jgi:AcrR family transcriptional regulator
LIKAATEAFAAGQDTIRLEDLAKAAGVGVGTLYRNFPSREALVEEVYRSELTRLCLSAERLLATRTPVDALRTWMRRYQAFVATKRGMLAAGVADGTLRGDVRPQDVSASLAGVRLAAVNAAQATRMLDLLVGGLRPR